MNKIKEKYWCHKCDDYHYTDKHLFLEENLFHNLGYDWDSELNELHGQDLWDTPNETSRKVRRMIVNECLFMRDKIKKLSWWRRLFNLF